MLTRILFINFSLNILFLTFTSELGQHGPTGLELNESTTCDEFSKYARFNPYSVLDTEWMVFYYWGPPRGYDYVYKFYTPGEKEAAYLKKILDGNVKKAINWTAKFVLMREKQNDTSLLVERNDRGEYDLYALYDYREGVTMEPVDVRIKQTGDNRYIGLMFCNDDIVYVMSRINDVPPKKKIQDTVARIGYRGRGGKSYLYQGHEWMPIPEGSEELYWKRATRKHWYLFE